jgi:hypothetical protein
MDMNSYTVVCRGVSHPAPHRQGQVGDLVRFNNTILFSLKVGAAFISVPQRWAAEVEEVAARAGH